MNRIDQAVILVLTTLLLAGCASTETPIPEPENLPDSLQEVSSVSLEETADWRDWWTRFDDDGLNTLVERALTENPDIRLQTLAVRQARAELGLSEAQQRPSLQAQADATREQNPQMSLSLGGGQGGGGGIFNIYSLSGMLNYEVDLWGRLASQEEAARSTLEQSRFSRDAVELGIVTEVVNTYFNLRAAEEQLRITEQNLTTRERTLELEQLRYEAGAADRFSVRQAESGVAAVRAQLPGLREQVQRLRNALAVLTAQEAGDILAGMDFEGHSLTELSVPGTLPDVLPASLLQRRPDIRAAEAGLRAADAALSATEASRWPGLNLSALMGVARVDFGDVFSGTLDNWNTGASLAGPLYDFGRSSARIESAEARREQAVVRYRQTVLTAFGEVRDALTLYENSDARLEAASNQVDAVRATRELAQIRYDEGLISFLELLDAERALLESRTQLTEARRLRLRGVTALFKALGGGWSSPAR